MLPFLSFLLAVLVVPSYSQCGIPSDAKPLAAKVHQLAALRDEAVSVRQAEARRVDAQIADWLMAAIQRTPSITAKELQTSIDAIVGQNSDDDGVQPKVFAQGWGTGTSKRTIVLAYMLDLGCMGQGCTFVRIESFVWEKQTGKVHSASKGGATLNGRRIAFQLITQYADRDEYWIMASGPPTGWSGRTFSGRAVLYRVNSTEVQSIWDRTSSGLTVQKNELGWEANYAVQDRFYMNKPNPYVFDVYALDWQKHSFSRVIHHRY